MTTVIRLYLVLTLTSLLASYRLHLFALVAKFDSMVIQERRPRFNSEFWPTRQVILGKTVGCSKVGPLVKKPPTGNKGKNCSSNHSNMQQQKEKQEAEKQEKQETTKRKKEEKKRRRIRRSRTKRRTRDDKRRRTRIR